MTSNQDYQMILFEKVNGVAIITLNRPEVLNAFNMQTLEEVNSALENVATDEEIRVLVLTGSGKAFSVGTDLAEVVKARETKGKIPFVETPLGLKIRNDFPGDRLTMRLNTLEFRSRLRMRLMGTLLQIPYRKYVQYWDRLFR